MTDQPEKQVVMCGPVEMITCFSGQGFFMSDGYLGELYLSMHKDRYDPFTIIGRVVIGTDVEITLARVELRDCSLQECATALWAEYCKNCQLMFGSNPGGF